MFLLPQLLVRCVFNVQNKLSFDIFSMWVYFLILRHFMNALYMLCRCTSNNHKFKGHIFETCLNSSSCHIIPLFKAITSASVSKNQMKIGLIMTFLWLFYYINWLVMKISHNCLILNTTAISTYNRHYRSQDAP